MLGNNNNTNKRRRNTSSKNTGNNSHPYPTGSTSSGERQHHTRTKDVTQRRNEELQSYPSQSHAGYGGISVVASGPDPYANKPFTAAYGCGQPYQPYPTQAAVAHQNFAALAQAPDTAYFQPLPTFFAPAAVATQDFAPLAQAPDTAYFQPSPTFFAPAAHAEFGGPPSPVPGMSIGRDGNYHFIFNQPSHSLAQLPLQYPTQPTSDRSGRFPTDQDKAPDPHESEEDDAHPIRVGPSRGQLAFLKKKLAEENQALYAEVRKGGRPPGQQPVGQLPADTCAWSGGCVSPRLLHISQPTEYLMDFLTDS
ncbi:hypothetical protein B0T17DRAFT_507359 [Bombardia bombarda]|uniref:Uncharacterized protein n=1 Tax=Bombardia bombarda TaxID=252184 RepID=A0AA39XCI3_9PEZI|nr:hypothetical protein B0T17DRAFT_507359 [Bombardia bombarda]